MLVLSLAALASENKRSLLKINMGITIIIILVFVSCSSIHCRDVPLYSLASVLFYIAATRDHGCYACFDVNQRWSPQLAD
jgi:hypothetical protein